MAEANATPPQDDYEQYLADDADAQKRQVDEQIAEQRAHNEEVKRLREARRTDLQPDLQDWQRRVSDLDKIRPPVLQRPPQAPDTQEMTRPTSLQKTFGMASIFALLSVGITKGASINGLRALGGFMKGAREGNLEQAKMAHQTFLDQMEEVHATNEAAIKDYNAIIGNKKLTLEQQSQMYRQKALEYKDEMGMLAQEQGGMNAVARDIKQKADIDFKMRQELDRRRRIEDTEKRTNIMAGRGSGAGGAMETVFGIPMSAIPEAPPGEKNEAFLKMLNPAQAQMIRQMDNGQLPVSGFGGFAVKDRNELLKGLAIFNPKAQANKYGLITKAQGELTPGGAVGTNVVAINTMAHHIDDFVNAYDALDNTQIQRWNSAKNKLATEFGDPALLRAQQAGLRVAGEYAKVIKGGRAAPTDQEMAAWEKVFTTSMSKSQMKAVVWEALQGAGGRLSALEDAYESLGGARALYPATQNIIMKYKPKNTPVPDWLLRANGLKGPSVEQIDKEKARQSGESKRVNKDVDGRPMHIDQASGRWVYD